MAKTRCSPPARIGNFAKAMTIVGKMTNAYFEAAAPAQIGSMMPKEAATPAP